MRWNGRRIEQAAGAVLAGVLSGSACAQETDFFESVLTEPAAEHGGRHWLEGEDWYLKGFLRHKLAYSLYERGDTAASRRDAGVSQSRTVLDLTVNGTVFDTGNYRIGGNLSLDSEDTFDEGWQWREVFADLEPVDGLWVKHGRQIIAWGESDFTQILDQANPRDNREIGLIEAEDLRIPVWATKISKVGDRWGMDVVLTHEFRGNRLAGEGDEFDPFVTLRDSATITGEDTPDVDFDDAEFLWRTFVSFPQGDLSVIYADVYDDSPALRSGAASGQLELFHPRVKVFGLAGNWVVDQWLFKGEVARKLGAAVPTRPGESVLTLEKPLTQLMLGAEYSVNGDIRLAAEAFAEQVGDYEPALLQPRTRVSLISALTFDLWRDTGELQFLWGHMIQEDSDLYRANFSYDYSDDIKLEAGYVRFEAGGPGAALYNYRDNDQVYASVRYSF